MNRLLRRLWELGENPKLCRNGKFAPKGRTSPNTNLRSHPEQGNYMYAEARQSYYPEPPTVYSPQPVLESERPETGASINDTWRPLDEAAFLQSNPHLTPAQADKYIERSAINFINEHSFRVPFSYFLGQLSPQGHMDIQGTNMSASWTRARQRFGLGSNEDYETRGYEVAHEMLRSGASGAVISSPQKVDEHGTQVDRRFTFILAKGDMYGTNNDYVDPHDADGEWFTQINLMHEGDQLPFDVARQQYAALERLTGQSTLHGPSMQTNKDMLTRPIALTDGSRQTLDATLSILGIGQEEISRSLELQAMAKNDHQLSEDISTYKRMIRELARHDLTNLGPEGAEVLKTTEALRNGIYVRANELYAKYKLRGDSDRIRVFELPPMSQDQRIAYYKQQKDPRVYGGISCPTASSSSTISQSLQDGESMSGTVGSDTLLCKECPMCKAKNIKAKIHDGKIHCPECKASAPYAC